MDSCFVHFSMNNQYLKKRKDTQTDKLRNNYIFIWFGNMKSNTHTHLQRKRDSKKRGRTQNYNQEIESHYLRELKFRKSTDKKIQIKIHLLIPSLTVLLLKDIVTKEWH